jgi:hypothetical protein
MRINDRDIYITRGDSESFRVVLYDQETETEKPFIDGDRIYFTVKTSTQTANKIFQIIVENFENEENNNNYGAAIVHITPQHTKDLKYHEYVYDVQLVRQGGEVTTIIIPSKFVVGEEVTYES